MENPLEIPSNWLCVEFEDVCDIISGKNQTRVQDPNGKYPIYGSGGIMGYANDYLCNAGTTIIGRKGTINNPIFVNEKFWNVDTAFGLSPVNSYNNKLFYFFCRQFNFKSLDKSTTIPSLTKTDLYKIKIPLPPLNEQNRIVSKIEELFSDLDHAEANLLKAETQLKVYRQALLKYAFEGKLTEQWRKENNPEPAEKLLERIQQERKNRYEEELKEWKAAVKVWEKEGKKGQRPSRPNKVATIEKPNAAHLNRKWSIPEKWNWTQLGTISFVTKLAGFEYTKYVNYTAAGDLSVIKAENASPNGFKTTEFSKVNSETVANLTRSQLFGGELLIVFVGAGTGNVAVVPKDSHFFLGPNIGMARPFGNIKSRFLEYFFQSIGGREMMMVTAKAVAQPSLSMGTIRQTLVALPSIEEQERLVEILDAQMEKVELLNKELQIGQKKIEHLKQSILKKAFSGELEPQNRLDESALELLKRIRAEKTDFNTAQKAIKKTKSKGTKTMDNPLIEIIKKKFGESEFSFDDLRAQSSLPYEELKTELFMLFEKPQKLFSKFDEELGVIKFYYKK